MKVFVAGATGILGRRAVQLLVESGHHVSAIARSAEKARLVEDLGAKAVRVDLFDAPAVEATVASHEAVMNLATHIPPPSRIALRRSWRENDRIRTHGSRNLVDAALAAGSRRYVQESIGFFYEDRGAEWLDEDSPVDLPKHARSTSDAEAEAGRFSQGGGIGVALRFGMFYAEDSPQTRMQVRLARMGISPLFGHSDEYQSLIHVDDAASAVVAALDAPEGIYNVVDDEPLTKGESAAVLAKAVGRKRLVAVPSLLCAAGGTVVRALLRSQRVSNKAFRHATAWAPRFPSAREGLPAIADR